MRNFLLLVTVSFIITSCSLTSEDIPVDNPETEVDTIGAEDQLLTGDSSNDVVIEVGTSEPEEVQEILNEYESPFSTPFGVEISFDEECKLVDSVTAPPQDSQTPPSGALDSYRFSCPSLEEYQGIRFYSLDSTGVNRGYEGYPNPGLITPEHFEGVQMAWKDESTWLNTERVTLNGRDYLVRNIKCMGDLCYGVHYYTFVGETVAEMIFHVQGIYCDDPQDCREENDRHSEEMEALFRQFVGKVSLN